MEGTTGSKSFAEAFEKQIAQDIENIRRGKIVKGTVVEIDHDFVHVDVKYKSLGVVPKEQFYNIDGKLTTKVGDVVDVFVLSLESDNDQILLSHERANQLRIWKEVEDKFTDGGIVTGKVQHKVKGGLQVDIGIPAFLPGSQVDLKPHKNLDKFTGKVFDFKVLKITKEKGNIVVSRRSLLVSEREELRSETLKVLSEGVVMEGTVKNITDYGAFIDLGGMDGLLHITDICWGHIEHPAEKLSVGQKLAVVVLSYDKEKERVSLGVKQLTEDPWKDISDTFAKGQTVKGEVVNITDFGVYVELSDGIEGLVHVDDMSWTKKVRNPGKSYAKGQEIEALITNLDTEERKLSLSIKHLGENPWTTLAERLPIGTKITGKVRSIMDFGIFVSAEEGIDGLVHLSDFSWTEKYKDANDIKKNYKKGQDIEAIVLDIDPAEERLSLGVKQLTEDPWKEIIQRYPVGTKVKGPVTALVDFGVFVQLEDGIDGLIHRSELGLAKDANVEEAFAVGKEIECEVVTVDPTEHQIGLSMRSIKRRERRDAISSFNDEVSAPTFGDLIKEKMDN